VDIERVATLGADAFLKLYGTEDAWLGSRRLAGRNSPLHFRRI